MGGRGASSGSVNGAITTGARDLKFGSVGKSFEKLPTSFQKSINDNLKMSAPMKEDIANGRRHKMTDTWTTGVKQEKIKVITDVVAGRAVYTIKQKNKILKKNATKEQAANMVAKFYIDEAKKQGLRIV